MGIGIESKMGKRFDATGTRSFAPDAKRGGVLQSLLFGA